MMVGYVQALVLPARDPNTAIVNWRDPGHPSSGGFEPYARAKAQGPLRGQMSAWRPAVRSCPYLECTYRFSPEATLLRIGEHRRDQAGGAT